MPSSPLSKYLAALEHMRLITRRLPIEAAASARKGHWHLSDDFFRFWFRFVFPFQADLESGLNAADLYSAEIGPALADHTAPVFEAWCRSWVRRNRGSTATRVGSWWGRALDSLRVARQRDTEEIDVVGTLRRCVTVVGEAKWTSKPMGMDVLADLENLKIPAMRQASLKVASDLKILLFSKSGYVQSLHRASTQRRDVELVDVAHELAR